MAIRINNKQLNLVLLAGQKMSNLCYNLCQSDRIPEEYRRTMKECWEEWDEMYPRKRTIVRDVGPSQPEGLATPKGYPRIPPKADRPV